MAEDHGLSGLFGNKGDDKKKAPDLPPVVDDADASPLERLAKKLGDQDPYADTASDDELHHSPFGLTVPQADAAAAEAPEAIEHERHADVCAGIQGIGEGKERGRCHAVAGVVG